MSNIDIAVACALLAAATVVFIFMVQPEDTDSAPHRTKLDQLLERRDAIYENLRDLNFEFRAGKYPEEDFQAQRAQLENETAELLAEMEHLERQA